MSTDTHRVAIRPYARNMKPFLLLGEISHKDVRSTYNRHGKRYLNNQSSPHPQESARRVKFPFFFFWLPLMDERWSWSIHQVCPSPPERIRNGSQPPSPRPQRQENCVAHFLVWLSDWTRGIINQQRWCGKWKEKETEKEVELPV